MTMKLLCTFALVTAGLILPGCVRSVGVYEERHPRHLNTTTAYDNDFSNHYRPTHRPYTSWHHRGNHAYRDHHDHHYRDNVYRETTGVRVQVRD
jgi:hypothetical protein